MQTNLSMREKLPVPCQSCQGTGLRAGIECRECKGKGYHLMIGSKRIAQARPERPKRWRG
jgi:DnaJ-class molecular chaperone